MTSLWIFTRLLRRAPARSFLFAISCSRWMSLILMAWNWLPFHSTQTSHHSRWFIIARSALHLIWSSGSLFLFCRCTLRTRVPRGMFWPIAFQEFCYQTLLWIGFEDVCFLEEVHRTHRLQMTRNGVSSSSRPPPPHGCVFSRFHSNFCFHTYFSHFL